MERKGRRGRGWQTRGKIEGGKREWRNEGGSIGERLRPGLKGKNAPLVTSVKVTTDVTLMTASTMVGGRLYSRLQGSRPKPRPQYSD